MGVRSTLYECFYPKPTFLLELLFPYIRNVDFTKQHLFVFLLPKVKLKFLKLKSKNIKHHHLPDPLHNESPSPQTPKN